MNVDSPDKSGAKANLYSILQRRKRTVEQYLKEHGIENLKQFKLFVKKLREQFIVSEKFVAEAELMFDKVQAVDKISKPKSRPVKKTATKRKKKTVSKANTEQVSGSFFTESR